MSGHRPPHLYQSGAATSSLPPLPSNPTSPCGMHAGQLPPRPARPARSSREPAPTASTRARPTPERRRLLHRKPRRRLRPSPLTPHSGRRHVAAERARTACLRLPRRRTRLPAPHLARGLRRAARPRRIRPLRSPSPTAVPLRRELWPDPFAGIRSTTSSNQTVPSAPDLVIPLRPGYFLGEVHISTKSPKFPDSYASIHRIVTLHP